MIGLGDPARDERGRGRLLLGELGCVACHAEEAGHAAVPPRRGPVLAGVARRLRPDYLTRFLADPRRIQAGTTMPDVLRDLDDEARAAAAAALAAYLRSFDEATPAHELPAREPHDEQAAARGHRLFHEIGCAACHGPREGDGGGALLRGAMPLGDLAAKYQPLGLREFLRAPLAMRPSGRMPDLRLAPAEVRDLSHHLLAPAASRSAVPARRADEAAASTPATVHAARVATGRALFAARCARCHDLDDPARDPAPGHAPLWQLDSDRGCMGDAAGPWPSYDLAREQRADLRAALEALDRPATDRERLRQGLAAFGCTACHERGDSGGPGPERAELFSGDATLGEDGRLPPPLTGAGAKLQRAWLVDAIAHGQTIRPYLETRMPGFGAAAATELADLLERVDQGAPPSFAPLPEDREDADAVLELGRELIGEQGMNCVACHRFAGETVGALAAVDLVDTTGERLRPGWFEQFLRAPATLRPGTLMPQFFAGGVSARPTLGGGDVAHQIGAMWHYLAAGRNVRKPSGMRPAPMPLVVGKEAVILRRRAQNTGKRAICVGYPLGVNLTFDAESLGLDQIWWGGFVDVVGVWTGQGSGEARILGKELAALPKGPAFVVLPAPEAPWPDASRRDLGHEFLGYDLDERRRPTFRYVCEGVTIADAPVDVPAAPGAPGAGRPVLRRTLTFTSPTDATLHFCAARDERVEDRGSGVVRVGRGLQLRLGAAAFKIRPAGEARELLVDVPLRGGRAELVIDYAWGVEPR